MTTPLHRAFAEHLLKVSKALHDLEWMFSGDTKPGDEVESIRAIVSPQEELAHTIERANIVLAELKDCLERVEHGKVN
ncbi:hypothetical protein HY745_02845 [Candidatus Desantisbacteria bacterium]|nr:hypothetical protein [Candidatus Desantisbacteria bacterium]